MKANLCAIVAGIACSCFLQAAHAQTLMNPGGFRGGPTVSGPPGGLTNPGLGGGPRLEPLKVDLKPTLPTVSAPTVNQSAGSQGAEPEAPKQPVPPTPPPESGADGDAETPDGSGTPSVNSPLATGAGEGECNLPPSPVAPACERGSTPWGWIGLGLVVGLLVGTRRRRSK